MVKLIFPTLNIFFSSVPSITVTIINDNTSRIVGESYVLTCRVFGAENLHPTITYQWMKNGGQIVGTNFSTLSFTPVRLSDAANYSCMVTIVSSYLTASVTAVASQSVRIQSMYMQLSIIIQSILLY